MERLEVCEDNLKDALSPFLTAIFAKFHLKKTMWLQILQILTELDCLASLAITSGQSDHPMCRPVFRESESSQSYLSVTEMIHPCVTMQSKKSFIPNDTKLDN